jgi:hypothetical protein
VEICRSADEPSRCELINSDGSSAEIKCRSMGTAIRCAKRNPKLNEIDAIRVRFICPSVPLRQRTCARGRYLGSSQCLYRNLCNWRESANVLRHRQLANRAAFLTNLVKSIEKSTLMPGRAKDGHSRPTSHGDLRLLLAIIFQTDLRAPAVQNCVPTLNVRMF